MPGQSRYLKRRGDMRTLEDFKVNPANDTLKVTVTDEPGAGGANHLYMIEGFDTTTNPSCPFVKRHGSPARHTTILFQNGPINENGVNGITQEVLLSIVCDRLRSQQGPFASARRLSAAPRSKRRSTGFCKSAAPRMDAVKAIGRRAGADTKTAALVAPRRRTLAIDPDPSVGSLARSRHSRLRAFFVSG
jgi:hypothetical protein